MFDDTEIIHEFLAESRENLDALDACLLQLERDPHATDGIAEVFRTIHTIKGTCGFLGFRNLERLTHHGENLLGKIRDGELTPSLQISDALLRTIDCVRATLDRIEAGQSDEIGELDGLIDELEQLAAGGMTQSAESSHVTSNGFSPTAGELEASPLETPDDLARNTPISSDSSPCPPAETESPAARDVTQASNSGAETKADVSGTQGAPNSGSVPTTAARTGQASVRDGGAETTSIRVSTELVDQLMDLVGELVLTRNQLRSWCDRENTFASNSLNQLSRLTNELQEAVVQTRLQPLDRLLQSVPRIVRDVALETGKQVEVQLDGGDTEVDRTILDAIRDPLIHLVRNAIDHGIESPEVRQSAGKPAAGTLRIRATNENGYILIDVEDDGRGLDFDRIRVIARERLGLPPHELDRMSDNALQKLIFEPGFSTSTSVSNISGRGVGMDVVKTNIEKIGGQLTLQSKPGYGTCVRITVPLTLTIVPSLLVGINDLKIAIPQSSVREIVGIEAEGSNWRLESVHCSHILRQAGRILPVYQLKALLHGADQPVSIDSSYVVIVRSQGREFGLAVEQLHETLEVVVKPLGQCLRGLSPFSGVTILGDGTLALMLNPPGLDVQADPRADAEEVATNTAIKDGDRVQALVVRIDGERFLVPTDTVVRLIQIDQDHLQSNRGRLMLQTQGEVVGLVDIDGRPCRTVQQWPHTFPAVLLRPPRATSAVALPVHEMVELIDVPRREFERDREVLLRGDIVCWLNPSAWSVQNREVESCHA